MKQGRWDFLFDGDLAALITRLSISLVALPVFLLAWWVFLQSPSRLATLTPVEKVEVWHEPLGGVTFSSETLETIVKTAPDWSAMTWKVATLPYVKELGAAVDLPPTAQKARVWIRIPVPEHQDGHGRLGLLGNRVIAHGPWALWVDRELVQANVVDWTIQLNFPLRVAVPMDAREVLLAVPYVEPMGYAVGSFFLGSMDVVDSAWSERNVWHMEASRFMAVAGLFLMVISFHLAWSRPKEPIFWVLGFNALAWSASCLQFVFGTNDRVLGIWFDFAVDTSTTWSVTLAVIFALDFERVQVPRLRAVLALYAAVSTIVVMPIWQWEKAALLGYHYFNVTALSAGLAVFFWSVFRKPRREGWVMLTVLVAQLVMGIYTLETLTNYSAPDEVFLYPIGIVVQYLTFSYVMNRRTVAALEQAEAHEQVLQQRLDDQQITLTEQHQRLQQLEIERNLASQRSSIMQDLHDRVGSNLTTALVQARSGKLTGDEALLVLQELSEEVRHMAKDEVKGSRPLGQLLSELRQRFEFRLQHAGIGLKWQVDPGMHRANVLADERHVRSILSEAIANAIKHARAVHIVVRAGMVSVDRAYVAIEDDGIGLAQGGFVEGLGLPGMRSRAAALGATINFSAIQGGGTRIYLELPARFTGSSEFANSGA